MTYLSTVLADNPVHYWRFADPGGAIAHDIGSSPVHLLGGVSPLTGPYTGIAADGASVYNAGGSGFRQTDNQTFTTPLSLEAWVWPLFIFGGALQAVIDLGFSNAGNHALLDLTTAGAANAGGTGTSGISSAALTQRSWHHLVWTATNAANNLYVDGANVATDAHGLSSPITQPVGIAQYFGGTNAGYFFYCEVATYGAALSAGQISAHYAAQEVSQAPVFLGAGNWLNSAYGATAGSPVGVLEQILASVRKTY